MLFNVKKFSDVETNPVPLVPMFEFSNTTIATVELPQWKLLKNVIIVFCFGVSFLLYLSLLYSQVSIRQASLLNSTEYC